MFILHLPREMSHNSSRPDLWVLEELRWVQTLTPEKPCGLREPFQGKAQKGSSLGSKNRCKQEKPRQVLVRWKVNMGAFCSLWWGWGREQSHRLQEVC